MTDSNGFIGMAEFVQGRTHHAGKDYIHNDIAKFNAELYMFIIFVVENSIRQAT
jgi:hypothetical protein